jgi:small GTP-binding protein
MKHIKFVIIGDECVGKSLFISSYVSGNFTSDYKPTIFEHYSETVEYHNKNYILDIWDTSGKLNNLIEELYRNTDVFIVCFSVTSKASYINAKNTWLQKIKLYSPMSKIILVGTKSDCRTNKCVDENLLLRKKSYVTSSMGMQLAIESGVLNYFECSIFNPKSIYAIFDNAIEHIDAIYNSIEQKVNKKKCVIM